MLEMSVLPEASIREKHFLMKEHELDISRIKCINDIVFGEGAFHEIRVKVEERQKLHVKKNLSPLFIFYLDSFFQDKADLINFCKSIDNVDLKFIDSSKEPTTDFIDALRDELMDAIKPSGLVAIGGGVTLDTVKAVSNLLNNQGNAEDYQGWDLVKNKGVYKIGVPTLSGTGAESSRTCVLTNEKTGLKLGMNSDFTLFDCLILDPDLTRSVPKDIFFYTLSDAFFHSMEALSGSLRNQLADAYALMAKNLCEQVFLLDNMRSNVGRSKAMLASYFGGIAIANSMTALIHPFSAGLSVVLKIPHTLANCLAMSGMEEFYPKERAIIMDAMKRHKIDLPSDICSQLNDEQFRKLIDSTVVHEKPLSNALGANFREVLTDSKIINIFKSI